MTAYDAIVVGAGYCGARIALHLKAAGLNVALIEREQGIMRRASLWNQARVHGGYHYPRSPITARGCRRSYLRFLRENGDCVLEPRRAFYAIARGSRVSPVQFEQFCHSIEAPLRPAARADANIFDQSLIEAAYLVDEASFDASLLAARLTRELEAAGVTLMLGTPVTRIDADGSTARVHVGGQTLSASLVFDCSYAGLGKIAGPVRAQLRREWAEMALIVPPQELAGCSITVMDGPFFSMMPFPSLNAYTLSHVRFTPVASWKAQEPEPESAAVFGPASSQNALAMVRDASRYVPAMRGARVRDSIFETKTILVDNDSNDGRPILLEKSDTVPGVYSILSGKIDNVYDIIDRIDELLRGGDTAPSGELARRSAVR